MHINRTKLIQLTRIKFLFTRRLAPNVSEVTFVCNVVDEGKIPVSLVNSKIKNVLSMVKRIKDYYERTRLEVSERSERALMETRVLAMNPAKWLQTRWLTSTTKLPTQFFVSLVLLLLP